MRYFLPMVRPSTGIEDHPYYYDISLDLAKMPVGLTPGEYASSIVHNMSTPRKVEQYNHTDNVGPRLSWSVLVEHVQTYGQTNGWREDGAEKAIEAILHKGARIDGMWEADLVEWPFAGDRCFLAWCDTVIAQAMLRKREGNTKYSNAADPKSNTCTQLGRWLVQRPHLMPLVPEVIVRLAQYVETIDSMPDSAFEAFVGTHHSLAVMHCEGLHKRRMDKRPQLRRQLIQILPKPKMHEWVENGWRSFCLGMAWEMRARGNGTIFGRITRTLNRTHSSTNGAQLALCMSDASWVQETMQATMREADMPFVEMNKKEKDYGLHPFSPDTLDHQEKKNVQRNVQSRRAVAPRMGRCGLQTGFGLFHARSFPDLYVPCQFFTAGGVHAALEGNAIRFPRRSFC